MGEEQIENQQEEKQQEESKKPCNKKKVAAIITLVVLIAGLVGTIFYEKYHIKQMKEERAKAQQQQVESLGKKPSDYAVGKDYNSVILTGKPALVLFYADWCRYCIRFMPIYEQAANKYGDDIEFVKVNVEDPRYQKLVQDSKIGGFPTVMIIDKKYDNKISIPNSSLGTLDDLGVELERFIKIRKLLDRK